MRHNLSLKIIILNRVNEENELCWIIRNIGPIHTALPVCIHNISCLFHVGHCAVRRLWSEACHLDPWENAQLD
jgi:hypothetical protein